MRGVARACGLWLGWMAAGSLAVAQAPTQALASDPDPPAYLFAVRIDAVQAWRREPAVQLDFALHPTHALWAIAGWVCGRGQGPLVGIGYRLRPMGRGVEGVALGVDLIARAVRGRAGRSSAALGLEVGYDVVFRGFALGGAVGLEVRREIGQAAGGGVDLGARVALRLGHAFR